MNSLSRRNVLRATVVLSTFGSGCTVLDDGAELGKVALGNLTDSEQRLRVQVTLDEETIVDRTVVLGPDTVASMDSSTEIPCVWRGRRGRFVVEVTGNDDSTSTELDSGSLWSVVALLPEPGSIQMNSRKDAPGGECDVTPSPTD